MVTINLLNDRMPTVKSTLAAIRALGLSARHRDGEYRITLPLNLEDYTRTVAIARAEDQAYYTNDAADAIETARAMIRK